LNFEGQGANFLLGKINFFFVSAILGGFETFDNISAFYQIINN